MRSRFPSAWRKFAFVAVVLTVAPATAQDAKKGEAEPNFDTTKVLEFSDEKVAAESLENGPPLGPVTVPMPQKWHSYIGPMLTYLVKFYPEKTQDGKVPFYPTITIIRQSLPADDTRFKDTDLNGGNVAEYAEAVAKSLDVKAQIERVEPLLIGKRYFARYVTRVKLGNKPLEKQVLKTVIAREEFTIELVVLDEKMLLQHRNKAYAVAAKFTFHPPK